MGSLLDLLCHGNVMLLRAAALTLLELQSHFEVKPLKLQVVCSQNGTAVLKGLSDSSSDTCWAPGKTNTAT